MAKGKKISELPELLELTGNENLVVQKGNTNAKVKASKVGFKDAPKDGKFYLRSNGEWEELPIPAYEDLYSYGVQWDVTNEGDPHLKRVGNMDMHKSLPIQSAFKGVVHKNKNIQYYLNENDWSLKQDGTPSKLDGTDGDVGIHIERFYIKSYVIGNLREVRISTKQLDSTWIEIPEMIISAWRTNVDNTENKTVCIINNDTKYRGGNNSSSYDSDADVNRRNLNKPRTAISRDSMRNYARKAGKELLCYDYYKAIMYWCYVIEYANFNSQEAFTTELTVEGYHKGGLGPSLTSMSAWDKYNNYNPITPCGLGNKLGNRTGQTELVIEATEGVSRQVFQVSRWRGWDNLFGDIWTNLEGIVLKREAAKLPSAVYTTSNPLNFDNQLENKEVAGIEIPQDGYIKEFDLGKTAEIIPSEIGGGATTYKCDYHYCNSEYTEPRTLRVGGGAFDGSAAGVGSFVSAHSVGGASSTVGFYTVDVIK